jgi:hypothetical protein
VLINVYLLLSLIFDIARARTLWLIPEALVRNLAVIMTLSTAIKMGVLILEAQEKRSILLGFTEICRQRPSVASIIDQCSGGLIRYFEAASPGYFGSETYTRPMIVLALRLCRGDFARHGKMRQKPTNIH